MSGPAVGEEPRALTGDHGDDEQAHLVDFAAAMAVGTVALTIGVLLLGSFESGTIEWFAVMLAAMFAGSLVDRDRFYGLRD